MVILRVSYFTEGKSERKLERKFNRFWGKLSINLQFLNTEITILLNPIANILIHEINSTDIQQIILMVTSATGWLSVYDILVTKFVIHCDK